MNRSLCFLWLSLAAPLVSASTSSANMPEFGSSGGDGSFSFFGPGASLTGGGTDLLGGMNPFSPGEPLPLLDFTSIGSDMIAGALSGVFTAGGVSIPFSFNRDSGLHGGGGIAEIDFFLQGLVPSVPADGNPISVAVPFTLGCFFPSPIYCPGVGGGGIARLEFQPQLTGDGPEMFLESALFDFIVPEPETWVLSLLGLAGLGVLRRFIG